MYRVLDLFSGIGGFSLGLERTGGFETVAFCEIDPFCRRVLAKHWPKVPCYHDVRKLTAERLAADGIGVDVICGGFPCQDISVAGKGAGLDGERSGLWSEIAHLAGELRPQFLIVENVSALLGRGLDRVLGDLAALGFDAEWHCIPASAVGAPHRRDRFWLVAYPRSSGQSVADTKSLRGDGGHVHSRRSEQGSEPGRSVRESGRDREDVSHSRSENVEGQRRLPIKVGEKLRNPSDGSWWLSEPNVGRVAHGVPSRVDRLRSLGNAVVPQIPEMIGRAILCHAKADIEG
jgi:DNA (cytosine-5)-methyltransferase 1